MVEGLTHDWAPCSLTDSQIHGLIKTGRFFENPLVGRHVLNVRPKKGVNLNADR